MAALPASHARTTNTRTKKARARARAVVLATMAKFAPRAEGPTPGLARAATVASRKLPPSRARFAPLGHSKCFVPTAKCVVLVGILTMVPASASTVLPGCIGLVPVARSASCALGIRIPRTTRLATSWVDTLNVRLTRRAPQCSFRFELRVPRKTAFVGRIRRALRVNGRRETLELTTIESAPTIGCARQTNGRRRPRRPTPTASVPLTLRARPRSGRRRPPALSTTASAKVTRHARPRSTRRVPAPDCKIAFAPLTRRAAPHSTRVRRRVDLQIGSAPFKQSALPEATRTPGQLLPPIAAARSVRQARSAAPPRRPRARIAIKGHSSLARVPCSAVSAARANTTMNRRLRRAPPARHAGRDSTIRTRGAKQSPTATFARAANGH